MPRAENLTIVGKCFLEIKLEKETIPRLKSVISDYMYRSNYSREDTVHPIFGDPFLCIKFIVSTKGEDPPLRFKLLKQFKLISESKYSSEIYFPFLKKKVDHAPFEISFIITPGQYKNKEGVIIEIHSKPAILFKINQLDYQFPNDEFKYSMIITSNNEFIYEIMKALNSDIIDNPAVIADYTKEIYKTPIIEDLEKYGFHNVAKIFREGLNKLKRGNVKEAFDELRAVLEIFTKEIAERFSDKTHPQDKIENNIQILETKNIISNEMGGVLIGIYYNKIYPYISDKVTHHRNELSIRDGEFLFSLIEDYIKYIIKKVIQ